ncbi:MAG: phosphatase PAP2 family protein [Roseburia sp.]|nr:phosphatase PAP2 family protein [Anaeroplasma bactoclasticum]MCM1195617.1 phosphatase PAP2 family protein [Roseburia sp.]MCM1556221.1 phosphatase PAP2 family protein [Anaeroplasma bactoclasticum]
MKKVFNSYIIIGLSCIGMFLILLVLLFTADKKVNFEGEIGLYEFNKIFLVDQYNGNWDSVSDVILLVSLGFLVGVAIYGVYQLTSKKSLFKVDKDILFVGGGILIILLFWVLFDKAIIVNYRPILIEMEAEASFPSTHVMLSTFILLCSGYCITKRESKKLIYKILSYTGFSIMILICVLGRLLSSMHWMTDILGGFLMGFGLFSLVVGLDKMFALKEKQSVKTEL